MILCCIKIKITNSKFLSIRIKFNFTRMTINLYWNLNSYMILGLYSQLDFTKAMIKISGGSHLLLRCYKYLLLKLNIISCRSIKFLLCGEFSWIYFNSKEENWHHCCISFPKIFLQSNNILHILNTTKYTLESGFILRRNENWTLIHKEINSECAYFLNIFLHIRCLINFYDSP